MQFSSLAVEENSTPGATLFPRDSVLRCGIPGGVGPRQSAVSDLRHQAPLPLHNPANSPDSANFPKSFETYASASRLIPVTPLAARTGSD